MDNVAHSLCGAALARAGLVRQGPLVTATLIVAANAPDVDALLYIFGDSTDALMHRRGWTHALALFVLQIPLLAFLFHRLGRRHARRKGTEEPCWRSLLLASTLGYLSHLGLDLLNTYGVRFLLPFDDTWFRGDMAFIVDPWMWLMFGAATLWGGGVRKAGYGLWAVLTALGVLGMQSRSVPTPAIALWVGAMLLCGIGRALKHANSTASRALLVLVAFYLVGLKAASHAARERGLRTVQQATSIVDLDSTVNPAPAIPWRANVVVATPETIHRVPINLFRDSSLDTITHSLQRNLSDPLLPSLEETREFRAWKRFARHPFVERHGSQIILGDGRFSYGGPNGWASFVLPIP
ncbi:MAG: inner membrane protein [Candidatus Paceibacteria bacterium]|jgi:inner membrane protein